GRRRWIDAEEGTALNGKRKSGNEFSAVHASYACASRLRVRGERQRPPCSVDGAGVDEGRLDDVRRAPSLLERAGIVERASVGAVQADPVAAAAVHQTPSGAGEVVDHRTVLHEEVDAAGCASASGAKSGGPGNVQRARVQNDLPRWEADSACIGNARAG